MSILQISLPSEVLESTDWHRFAGDDAPDSLNRISRRIFEELNGLPAEGSTPMAQLLFLIACATSMELRDGSKPPLQPAARNREQRTAALGDFDANDLAALAAIAARAPTAFLRARFGDLAASGNSKIHWRSGALAVVAYLDIAEKHLAGPTGMKVLAEFKRGLQIVLAYHRNDLPLYDRYWAIASAAIKASLSSSPAVAIALIGEVLKRNTDLALDFAPLFENAAHRLAGSGELGPAADCFDWAFQLWRSVSMPDDAKRCQILFAETLLSIGSEQSLPAITQALWTRKAAETFRRAGADPQRLKEVAARLANLQPRTLGELDRIHIRVDAETLVDTIQLTVVGPGLLDSLLQMSFDLNGWLSYEDLKTAVISKAQQSPTATFAADFVDDEGTIVGHLRAFNPEIPDAPEWIYDAVVDDAHRIALAARADIVVPYCADIIFSNHRPHLFQILYLVRQSGLVPNGHAESLARGFLAGINGDWLDAAVYLIPKVEPLVRFHLRQNGAATLTSRNGGIQAEKTLNELLDTPEAVNTFGENLLLEFRTLLIHPLGFRLRHTWAHGLVGDAEISTKGIRCLWWVLWRLILWPWGMDRLQATDSICDGNGFEAKD